MRHALVFGGSGHVGAEVLKGLKAAGIAATFTFHRSKEKAAALAQETGHRAVALNLADPRATRAFCDELTEPIDLFIHCAAVSKPLPLAEITDDDWEAAQRINCHSAFLAAQRLAPGMAKQKSGDIVLVGALDRGQTLPLPVHFAATQGMLSAMAMALAKELGPSGIRVNVIALGALDGGIGTSLSPKLVADYKGFSALRRTGTAAEVAKAILWLATANTYISGRVVPVNGGI